MSDLNTELLTKLRDSFIWRDQGMGHGYITLVASQEVLHELFQAINKTLGIPDEDVKINTKGPITLAEGTTAPESSLMLIDRTVHRELKEAKARLDNIRDPDPRFKSFLIPFLQETLLDEKETTMASVQVVAKEHNARVHKAIEMVNDMAKAITTAQASAYSWEAACRLREDPENKMPCGHHQNCGYSPDGAGKLIKCYLCEKEQLEDTLTRVSMIIPEGYRVAKESVLDQVKALVDGLMAFATSREAIRQLQPYALSSYPGEFALVPIHPKNTEQKWLKMEEVLTALLEPEIVYNALSLLKAELRSADREIERLNLMVKMLEPHPVEVEMKKTIEEQNQVIEELKKKVVSFEAEIANKTHRRPTIM